MLEGDFLTSAVRNGFLSTLPRGEASSRMAVRRCKAFLNGWFLIATLFRAGSDCPCLVRQ